MPDQRHLYMLVAGVLLGVLLGPAVLGRLAPQAYDQMFLGSGDTSGLETAQTGLDGFLSGESEDYQKRIHDKVAQIGLLEEGGSARLQEEDFLLQLQNEYADALQEHQDKVSQARVPILANQQSHREKLSGMATMMLLLIVVILAAEAILSPTRGEAESGQTTLPPALSRLVTIRYGLASGWLMLMLAQPVWLRGIDVVFGVLLLAVVLLAGLVPLGKKAE